MAQKTLIYEYLIRLIQNHKQTYFLYFYFLFSKSTSKVKSVLVTRSIENISKGEQRVLKISVFLFTIRI